MSQKVAPAPADPFGARATLDIGDGTTVTYYRLGKLAEDGLLELDRLPFTIRILLENVLRHAGEEHADPANVETLAKWRPGATSDRELPFMPGRVVLQDFTGVPGVVDLAAMRGAVARLGGDVSRINPLVPADLVIDHSVQVDRFGTTFAFARNIEFEYHRNGERYALLRWAQQAFENFRVVPPSTGIVHQVNLEYLGRVVLTRQEGTETVAFPDTLVGTDSHTPMINGLGVLGWGVGGIEAEAVLLGQPLYLLMPEVIGIRLTGSLREGATATDLVLAVTEMLRKHGVVGRFVEYFGAGLSNLALADRATIGNMSPECGATASLFPVDHVTLDYLRLTARGELIPLVERYCKEQGLFRTDATPEPTFNEVLDLDLGSIEPSLAGPSLPQQRVPLANVGDTFHNAFASVLKAPVVAGSRSAASGNAASRQAAAASEGTVATAERSDGVLIDMDGIETTIHHGSVAIAAITSCTNTSNPSVMVGAGLLAKNAVERGLKVPPYVKTSMAPGSQVVTRYLEKSDLLPFLEALGFHVVGYGCTTCIGNSGPLPQAVANAVDENDLVVAAVLSGNRNFEGRIHPQVRASFLASPPLVVAFALAGRVDIDLSQEPVGLDPNGEPVYLKDIWPTQEEIRATILNSLDASMFQEEYGSVFTGDKRWRDLPIPAGNLYEWDADSTYIQEPPYFIDMAPEPPAVPDIEGARVLALLGNSVTTDHISPAGAIAKTSPAGQYLIEHGVQPLEFNSYGSRRGNHEVMIRGTFANIRLKNLLTPGKEGNRTVYLPTGEEMSIFDAAMRYADDGTPLVVIAGKEYGSGSSRDWAAKGTLLLGVRAVIAESYERIHRSNLIGMGVLPLQFQEGENAVSLGLTGHETYTIRGLDALKPRGVLTVEEKTEQGEPRTFQVIARADSPIEVAYYRHGGVLPYVLRRMAADGAGTQQA